MLQGRSSETLSQWERVGPKDRGEGLRPFRKEVRTRHCGGGFFSIVEMRNPHPPCCAGHPLPMGEGILSAPSP